MEVKGNIPWAKKFENTHREFWLKRTSALRSAVAIFLRNQIKVNN